MYKGLKVLVIVLGLGNLAGGIMLPSVGHVVLGVICLAAGVLV